MKFLVELDHPKTGQPLTEDAARSFIEGIIFPTIALPSRRFFNA